MKAKKRSSSTVTKGESQPEDNQPKSENYAVENDARDTNSIGSMKYCQHEELQSEQ